jgi:hypothetical protein
VGCVRLLSAQAAARGAAGCREPWRRQHLQRLMSVVRSRLGVPVGSPIIPLVVGSEAAALQLSRTLLMAGYHVPAIRPPTVPAGGTGAALKGGRSAGQGVVVVVGEEGEGRQLILLALLSHCGACHQLYHPTGGGQSSSSRAKFVSMYVGGSFGGAYCHKLMALNRTAHVGVRTVDLEECKVAGVVVRVQHPH